MLMPYAHPVLTGVVCTLHYAGVVVVVESRISLPLGLAGWLSLWLPYLIGSGIKRICRRRPLQVVYPHLC